MTPENQNRRKADKLIWYFMVTSITIIIGGGGAWATNVNTKVDKIVGLEITVQYMQRDLREIKEILKSATTSILPSKTTIEEDKH